MIVGHVDDRPIGKHAPQALLEDDVVALAEKAVAKEKAAAQQMLAELRRLLVRQLPGSREPGDEKRPIMRVVAVLEINGLLHGAHVRAREAPQHLDERTVALRIVVGPSRAAVPPLPARSEAAIGEHQMADDELAGNLVVGRQRRLGHVAFEARINAKLALRGSLRRDGDRAGDDQSTGDGREAAMDFDHEPTIPQGRAERVMRPYAAEASDAHGARSH
jgi:hypothetical protein